MHLLEAGSLLMTLAITFTFYNPVGELAGSSGRDFAWLVDGITRSLDEKIPCIPAFVFPYIGVYAMPFVLVAVLLSTRGANDAVMGSIRRLVLTQMLMMCAAFACYSAFPVKTDLLVDAFGQRIVDVESSWLARLNYQFVHVGISKFVACPSMHVAHSFACAAVWTAHGLPGKAAAKALAYITLGSTIFTKAHPVPHLWLGWALAQFFHQRVFLPLEAARVLESPKAFSQSWMRLAILALAPVAMLMIGEQLSVASGWTTDVPAMFAASPNPQSGFYGLRTDAPYRAVRNTMDAVYGCYLQPATCFSAA